MKKKSKKPENFTNHNMATINDLPAEIVEMIFLYTDVYSAHCLALTNRFFLAVRRNQNRIRMKKLWQRITSKECIPGGWYRRYNKKEQNKDIIEKEQNEKKINRKNQKSLRNVTKKTNDLKSKQKSKKFNNQSLSKRGKNNKHPSYKINRKLRFN